MKNFRVRLRLGKKKDQHAVDLFSWQGFQPVVQTLDDTEFENVVVQEIRELFSKQGGI
ncbi:MAG: hypothetical protein JWL85_28 [Candidatus Saccharibacteria bacterium]|nr:hypothetical protein [Candidatus Saccharibacteria bacterium]